MWLKHLKEACDPVGWYFGAKGNFEILSSLQCPTSRHHKVCAALINMRCLCEQVKCAPQDSKSCWTKQHMPCLLPQGLFIYLFIYSLGKCRGWHHTTPCLKPDITIIRKQKPPKTSTTKTFPFQLFLRSLQSIKTCHIQTIFIAFVL